MSKCLVILKCAAISKWQLCLTLASFPLLADYPSVKMTSENIIKKTKDCKYFTFTQNLPDISFDLSCFIQIVQFLPDNNTISYVIYLSDTTNKANIDWSLIKFKWVTRNILLAELYIITQGFDIEKQYWERYQIMQKKSYQHQRYKIYKMGKNEIEEYRIYE